MDVRKDGWIASRMNGRKDRRVGARKEEQRKEGRINERNELMNEQRNKETSEGWMDEIK